MAGPSNDERAQLTAELREAVPAGTTDVVEVARGPLPEMAPGSVGAAVLMVPLDEVADPLAALRTVRSWLRPDGVVVCAVTNFADHAALVQLLRSDPQQAPAGVVGPATQHVHGYATALKLLLEAGFSPAIVDAPGEEVDAALLDAAKPLLEHLRVHAERAAHHLAARRYVLVGRPLADLDESPYAGSPLTFVACVNDDLQLRHNLLASPCLAEGSPHELLLYRGMGSAAEGLNRGIREASHDLVVLVQQDIYLPSWWPARLVAQWAAASAEDPPAVGGPVGVRYREGGREHVGHAVDRDQLFRTDHTLPATVDGLDELVMVVPKDGELRFDPRVGWHLYGTDLVLQAHAAGRRAVALDVPCHHNSLLSELQGSYHDAESALAGKWPQELPIVTNSTTIDHDPRDARAAALEESLEGAWAGAAELRTHIAGLETALADAQRAVAERDAVIATQAARWPERARRAAGRILRRG